LRLELGLPDPPGAVRDLENQMDQSNISMIINIVSVLVAIVSACYAILQAKEAKKSALRSEESVKEAHTQNKINALLILKEYLEKTIPKIEKLADHFLTPGSYFPQGKSLRDECEALRKKLQRVDAEIENLYELYVPAKKA
jgi:hypothetical protein